MATVDVTVDVTVRGAGVFGLSVAFCCAQRGARVRVVDPAGPAAGASGGVLGALAPHVPENWNDKKAFQLASLLRAEGFWREVADTGGLPTGYARLGRLQPLPDAAAVARAEARAGSARALWRDAARWEVVAAGGDWAPVSPTGRLVHDTLSARVHPRRATLALAAAVRALGGEVVPEAEDAGRVVWATGWRGLLAIAEATGRPAGNGVKGQAAVLALDRRDLPQLFADGIHIVPHADGTVAVGSTSERDFDAPDTTDGALDALLDRARSAVPALAGAPVLTRWAGVRPRTRSRAPMLGPHPARPGAFVANGGFKIGFGMAPEAGEAMADLLLDGIDRIPEGFRPAASL